MYFRYISNFTKISPVGAALFHPYERIDRQTDGYDWTNSRFCQFCERAIWNKIFNMKYNYVFCEIFVFCATSNNCFSCSGSWRCACELLCTQIWQNSFYLISIIFLQKFLQERKIPLCLNRDSNNTLSWFPKAYQFRKPSFCCDGQSCVEGCIDNT